MLGILNWFLPYCRVVCQIISIEVALVPVQERERNVENAPRRHEESLRISQKVSHFRLAAILIYEVEPFPNSFLKLVLYMQNGKTICSFQRCSSIPGHQTGSTTSTLTVYINLVVSKYIYSKKANLSSKIWSLIITYVSLYVYICICIYTYVCMFTCVCKCKCIYVYVCRYVCLFVYIYRYNIVKKLILKYLL